MRTGGTARDKECRRKYASEGDVAVEEGGGREGRGRGCSTQAMMKADECIFARVMLFACYAVGGGTGVGVCVGVSLLHPVRRCNGLMSGCVLERAFV